MRKKLSILLSFCLFGMPGIAPIAPVFAQCNFGGPPPKEDPQSKGEGDATSKDKGGGGGPSKEKPVGDSTMPKGEIPKAYEDRNKGLQEAKTLETEQQKVQQAIAANQQLASQAAAAGDQNSAATARSNMAGLRQLSGSLGQRSSGIRTRIQTAAAVIRDAENKGIQGTTYGNVQARPYRGIAPKGRKRPRGPIFLTPWPALGPKTTYGPAEPQRYHEVTAGPIGADMSLATPVGGCGGVFIGPADAKMPPNSILNVGDCKGAGASTCHMEVEKGGAMVDTCKPTALPAKTQEHTVPLKTDEKVIGRVRPTSVTPRAPISAASAPSSSSCEPDDGGGGDPITPTEPPSGGGGSRYRPLPGEEGGGGGGGGGGSKKMAKLMTFALVAGAAAFVFTKAKVVAKKEKDGSSSVVVLDGEVKAVDKDGKNEMILKAGQGMKVGADGSWPEEPKKVNFAKLNRWWEEKGSKKAAKEGAEEERPEPEEETVSQEAPPVEEAVSEPDKEKAPELKEKEKPAEEEKPAVEKKRPSKEKGEVKGKPAKKGKTEIKAEEKSSKEKVEAEEPKKPAKKKGVRRAE